MSTCILVVEDHELVRDMIARVLRRKGYFVVTASHGQQGLEQFRRFAPDLVITDIMMPEKDGIELTTAIRRLNPQTKILVMSGYEGRSGVDLLPLIRGCGADDIVGKPFELSRLLAKVHGCLGTAKHSPIA